ncbi:DNA replication ATPase [Lacticaseibacillus thailandensis DSM 22698 = JCM 13996]|uniref:DNA replication ATPase n=2 Tax=Lacticaseibacillus thailandensis TaxID=381741 RepID=A0A0R2C4Z2_9LACO|nr:DNA replication ATPase [Lacticaseibacillus thailandensis DSM 22698 = JCM 13996]
MLTGNHTDVLTIRPEGTTVKADAVRGLKAEMSKSGVEGNRRVFIIEDADRMTAAAANSLLKFFEEPYPGMLIILTTTNRNGLLPTVLSRAQVIQFPAPRRRDVEAQLVKAGVAASRAGVVARMTVSVDDGVALANDEDVAKRIHVMLQLVARLAAHDELAFPFIQTDVVKACPDRDSQRQFVRLLALAYSEAINRCYGAEAAVFKQDAGVAKLATLPGATVAAGMQIVLNAAAQIESNVNFQANMEQMVLLILRG